MRRVNRSGRRWPDKIVSEEESALNWQDIKKGKKVVQSRRLDILVLYIVLYIAVVGCTSYHISSPMHHRRRLHSLVCNIFTDENNN